MNQAEQPENRDFTTEGDDVSVSETVRNTIESHIEPRRADDGFQERLAASMQLHQRILDRLAG